jgi:hypothetical protein
VRGIPRIAGGAEQTRLGGAGQAELGGVGLADDHQPGALEPPGDLAVVIRHEVLEERAAPARNRALIVRAEILQQVGHPGEGPGGQPGRDRGAGLVVEPADHRIDLGVTGLDRGDRGVEHLGRADLLAADQLCQSHPIVARELVGLHHVSCLPSGMSCTPRCPSASRPLVPGVEFLADNAADPLPRREHDPSAAEPHARNPNQEK